MLLPGRLLDFVGKSHWTQGRRRTSDALPPLLALPIMSLPGPSLPRLAPMVELWCAFRRVQGVNCCSQGCVTTLTAGQRSLHLNRPTNECTDGKGCPTACNACII